MAYTDKQSRSESKLSAWLVLRVMNFVSFSGNRLDDKDIFVCTNGYAIALLHCYSTFSPHSSRKGPLPFLFISIFLPLLI